MKKKGILRAALLALLLFTGAAAWAAADEEAVTEATTEQAAPDAAAARDLLGALQGVDASDIAAARDMLGALQGVDSSDVSAALDMLAKLRDANSPEVAAVRDMLGALEGVGTPDVSAVLNDPAARQLWEELFALLMATDPEQALEYANTAYAVLSSEEFNRLMEYPQMQALAQTALSESAAFALENKDLTAQILLKLGVNETAVNVFRGLLDTFD